MLILFISIERVPRITLKSPIGEVELCTTYIDPLLWILIVVYSCDDTTFNLLVLRYATDNISIFRFDNFLNNKSITNYTFKIECTCTTKKCNECPIAKIGSFQCT
ncbi:hypothetical protein Glove_136g139 [Diversispora epigaea]|uniref:Uncharacterized protein n=1 Tax=Diversispora epigaea TaxID=1348612 RepID=A0A397IWV0_9GLOM|nr:hypothetical protein Glove_136g139 [Diversispora epigaea]